MRTDTNELDDDPGPQRSWLYCETCDWARIVRSATTASAFALAEEDARTHAALTAYDADPHRVHAINAATREVESFVHE